MQRACPNRSAKAPLRFVCTFPAGLKLGGSDTPIPGSTGSKPAAKPVPKLIDITEIHIGGNNLLSIHNLHVCAGPVVVPLCCSTGKIQHSPLVPCMAPWSSWPGRAHRVLLLLAIFRRSCSELCLASLSLDARVAQRFLYGYPKGTVNSYINGERHLFPRQHSGLTVSEVQLRAQAVAADNASLTDRDLGHFLEEHVARHASASRDPQRSWRAAGSVSHSPISSLQRLLQEEKLLCSARQLLRHLCPAISHGGTGMGQFLPCLRPVFSRRTKVKQIIPCYCRE